MSLELIKKDGYNATLKMVVKREEFDKYCDESYKKNKNKINIPGFRKGKVPKHMVEKYYGEGFFYEDAINSIFSNNFYDEMEKTGLEPVDTPVIDLEEIQKDKDVVINIEVVVSPDVELGQYRGLEIPYMEAEVTDAQVDEELENRRNQNARYVTVENRAVKDQDTVFLDFEGKKDGVGFDGGKAENYRLVIGSHSFIDGFEDALIGMNIGDEKTIDLKFPENYHEKSLAGQPVTFDVRINQIQERQLPDLDDEFVKDISEFDTLDELKADIRKELEKHMQEHAEADFEDEIITHIINDSKMDLPPVMVDHQTDMMYGEFANSLMYQGLDINTYLQYINKTQEELKSEMRSEAEKRVKSSLVLKKVKEVENVGYSEDQVDAEIRKMAEAYRVDEDKIRDMIGEEQREHMIDKIIFRNTVEFLKGETKRK